jgi:hypothetical protein
MATRLRKVGFIEDQSPDAPICRWRGNGILLDVMPTHPEILGFGNEWYQLAFASAKKQILPSGKRISLISAPYFLVTKLAAFDGRGQGDYMISHDIEDIVAVIDGRPEMTEEVANSNPVLRDHIRSRLVAMLKDRRFLESLPGHMPGDEASQARVPIVIQRLRSMCT